MITRRDPDSLRGPDVTFYGVAKLAALPEHDDYFSFAPDLVVEVLSPADRPQETQRRVSEYLGAGVQVVAVFNPRKRQLVQYRADGDIEFLNANDVWTVPELLPGFSVRVAELAGVPPAAT